MSKSHWARTHRSFGASALKLSAVATLTMLIAACGADERAGFHPHPSNKDKPKLEKKVTAHSHNDMVSKKDLPEPNKANTEQPSEELSEQTVLLYPNGKEVKMTPLGAKLKFGEPAHVVTEDTEGRYLVWAVTAHDGVRLPSERVSLLNASETDEVSHFMCYAYDVEFLGAIPKGSDDPLALSGLADAEHTAVTAPTLMPATGSGDNALHLNGGADNACGIPASNRIPTSESQLKVNHVYARGSIGVFPKNQDSEDNKQAQSVRFDWDQSGEKSRESLYWS
ncbi:hypothetical protein [Corynebacterium silvaticum]|uniref:Uncharacterized protein n=1 Tax=Corynebacterium silvaticum TaxID=2320431 RepID=A0A7U5KA72_9CORY|nr:hypothetical protein [Corynebacterium silvaticum]ARU47072.2 hypothetical protein CBE74_03290 [Corynebacterium silvaticum]